MKIFLIGYMGSGKSKTAKEIAAKLKYKFLDTDKIIEEQAEKTVSEIFEKRGEEYFRKLEKKVLRSTAEMNKVVIATGGGMPCFNNNMDWMNENGITIYLEAGEGLLFHRLLTNKKDRPLIKKISDVELMMTISKHLGEREPFYNRAKLKVNAMNVNAKKIIEKINTLK